MLKVVGYYDVSEHSVHVSDGFPKKSLDGGWVGGVSSIQFVLDFWNLFHFAKPLIRHQLQRGNNQLIHGGVLTTREGRQMSESLSVSE